MCWMKGTVREVGRQGQPSVGGGLLTSPARSFGLRRAEALGTGEGPARRTLRGPGSLAVLSALSEQPESRPLVAALLAIPQGQ